MAHSIGVFDTNDGGSIEAIVNKYTDTAVFHSDKNDIEKVLGFMAKKPILNLLSTSKKTYAYLLIHQSDFDDLPDNVRTWIHSNRTNIFFYSGGATGEGDVLQRAEITRKLEDFILRVESNEDDPWQTFRVQKPPSVNQWDHIYRHEYGNIYAPLDYLSLFYQGGDVSKDTYEKIKGDLQSRARNHLQSKSHSTEKWDAFFKKGEEDFIDIESVEFRLGDFLPLSWFASFPVIHIDDEIDRGWDIVFPAIFGDNYIQANNAKEGMAEIEKVADGSCVVFLDLRMPNAPGNQPDKETGLATLRKIREKWPLLPVYVFSANTDYESYGDAMREGASGYLVKFARSLEARSDSVLYRELWEVMRSARIENIAHCLYSAFSSIESHNSFAKLEQKPRTKSALLEIRQALQSISFARLAIDDKRTLDHARIMTIVMYKSLEHYVQKKEINRSSYKPIEFEDSLNNLPRQLRNFSAHGEKIELNEGRVFPSMREALLSASFVILKWGDLLEDEEWVTKHLDWLLSIVQNNIDINEIETRQFSNGIYDENEKALGRFQDFIKKQLKPDWHRIVKILAVDICDSKNLSDGSNFSWFNANNLCRIDYSRARLRIQSSALSVPSQATRPTITSKTDEPINRQASAPRLTQNRKKTSLEDKFDFQDGIFFHRMQKYNGQAVDLSDASQFKYLEWYFTAHIEPDPDSFTEEIRLKFQEWLSTPQPKAAVSIEELTPTTHKISNLDVLCLDITPLGATDPREDIVGFARDDDPAWIPRIKRSQKDSLYRPSLSSGSNPMLKGIRMNNPLSVEGLRLLPISPSVMLFETPHPSQSITGRWVFDGEKVWLPDERESLTGIESLKIISEGSQPSTIHDAKAAFDEVLRLANLNSLPVSGPISWDRLGTPGQFSKVALVDDSDKTFSLEKANSIIRQSLNGVKLTILDRADHPAGADALRTSMSGSVGSPVWVNSVEDSEAFIAIINKGLSNNQIETLLCELNDYGKPYMVVNPGPSTYKTFGIALGLKSRLSTPLWTLSGRKPRRIFIGLDVGSRKGDESILAASCVDHTGRLRAWCRVSNPGRGKGPEMINANTFQKAISLLWDKVSVELNHDMASYELVIHRDGNTLEDEQEFISILRDIGFSNTIDWVDVIKRGAPIITGDMSNQSGLYLHVNDNGNAEQYWNMQSIPQGDKYIRPLVVKRIEGDTSFSVLASEVFYLGQVSTHDYLARQKLPVTTYYADGFSKSGGEFLRFAGYEHMRAF